MTHETIYLLSLTLTLPLDETEVGLEPRQMSTWTLGVNPGLAIAIWKKKHPSMASCLTSHVVLTPTRKPPTAEYEKAKEAIHHGGFPKLPKPKNTGKPRGIFAKPGERTAGVIHIR